jgi:hypothetical protein
MVVERRRRACSNSGYLSVLQGGQQHSHLMLPIPLAKQQPLQGCPDGSQWSGAFCTQK